MDGEGRTSQLPNLTEDRRRPNYKHVSTVGRRLIAATGALALSCAAITATAMPAWGAKKPVIPSQSQVDQASATAHAKAVQIGETEAQLAAANAQLDKLNANAEATVEAYDGAQAKLAAAQQFVTKAQAALSVAQAARAKAQLQMNQFAADSYRGTSNVGQISALIMSGSPQEFANREATLSAIASHREGIINTMMQAVSAQNDAQKAADQALSDQQAASNAAQKAKDAAVQAVNAQASQVSQIKSSQVDLNAQLAVLKGKAKNLAAARAQGLAELAAEQAAAKKAAAEAKARQLELAKEAAERAKAQAQQVSSNSNGSNSNGSNSGGSNSGGSGSVPLDSVVPGSGHSVSTAAQRATAIAFAENQIGVWYRWAGAGEIGPTVTDSGTQNIVGYDCSGLTMRAYQAAGISLGHYTGLQWDIGMHVSQSQLVPGDLVFFATNTSDPGTIHHVGIYIGNGQMVDAPQTGEQVGIHNAFRSDYIGAVQP
ncbi:MAG: C40 family peptidase [Acidothermaceae bacterium]